ncbi:MAG: DUF2917 domain-containing protein [Deltaproteobacteria bacterium]|nr:DUF2917 domain-containing protein [Deltaproteobacteria bacterium]
MEILLRKGELLILEGSRRGRLVRCGDGILWITQEGDRRDHLLRRGGSFASALVGRIVVSALSDCRLTLLRNDPVAAGKGIRIPRLEVSGDGF